MVTRRRFVLATAGVGRGARVVGWSVLPPRQRMTGRRPLTTAPGESAMNGWVKVAEDGTVTVMLAKSEMGQGVMTSLAMLLADEMDADWSMVRTEMAPIDAIYNAIPAGGRWVAFSPRRSERTQTAWRLDDGQGHARDRRHDDRRLLEHQGSVAAHA